MGCLFRQLGFEMKQALPTATLIAKIKRDAKRRSRTGAITHSLALDEAAQAAGYGHWQALQQAHIATVRAQQIGEAESLPLDPKLPDNFDNTPNEERSTAELDAWWERPFAVSCEDGTLLVRCLDGGAWDRATFYGTAPDMAAAVELAKKKLASWRAFRSRPFVDAGDGESARILRMPQRPDQDWELLATVASTHAAAAWLEEHGYRR